MRSRTSKESFSESFPVEEKFPLTTAAKIAFNSHYARPPSRATLFRWIRKGKYGIKMQSRRFNGNYQTSVEAIHRFIEAVDEAAATSEQRAGRRKQQLDHVSAALDRLGL